MRLTQKELKKQLSLSGGQYGVEFLKQLQITITNYLQRAESIQINVNKRLEVFDFSNIQIDGELSEQYKRWLIAKMMINEDNTIEPCLREGYELIDRLRTAVTGESLKYFVGVVAGRGSKKQLYEGFLTLKQIMSMTNLEPIWQNTANSLFKLRLRTKKSELLKSLKPASTASKNLYQEIINYASANENRIKNEGNIFEAYRYMRKNKIQFSPEKFDEIYLQTRANTASFVQGGDIDIESVKYFGGNAPSLVSLSTIISALRSFNQAIGLTSLSEIQNALFVLFEKQMPDLTDQLEQEQNQVISQSSQQLMRLLPNK